MLFDSHTHVNFNAFKDDWETVLKNTLAENIWVINVGSQSSTSRRAVQIASHFEKGVYACVGLHPIHLFEMKVDESELGLHFATRPEEFDFDFYSRLGQESYCLGIGEIGLDFYYLENFSEEELKKIKEKQIEVFRKQIDLSAELSLPVMLHCRGSKSDPLDAYKLMLEILREEKRNGKIKKGVIHCFTADREIAKQFLDLGFYLGFTGIITYPKTLELQKVVFETPLERILLETDAPYLAPQAKRGQRNEPIFVKYVCEKVAEIKGKDFQEIAQRTFENTLNLFSKIRV